MFYRLELWIKENCDEYEPNIISRIAVFFVYVPMFIYFGLTVIALTNRRLHHVMMSLGLWVADSIIWMASFTVAGVASPAKHCGHRVSLRPAEEAAIVWYVCIFQLIYAAKHGFKARDVDERIQAGIQVWILFVVAIMCTLSQYYLQLFDWFELGMGTLCGICAASLWMGVVYVTFEKEPRKRKVAGWLRATETSSM